MGTQALPFAMLERLIQQLEKRRSAKLFFFFKVLETAKPTGFEGGTDTKAEVHTEVSPMGDPW